MTEAKRLLFWENDARFGIRMGHNLSYLDTLQYIDNNDTTLMLDFKLNGISEGTSYSYVFATGSSTYYSMEYDRINQAKRLYMNIGATTTIVVPSVIPYEFNNRLLFSVNTNNGAFKLIETDVNAGSYEKAIIPERTLTIGCAVNRNIQEGLRPTVESALRWNRIDTTVFGLRILKENNIVFNLQPMIKDDVACFKDTISQKLFYSNGPDAFEIDEMLECEI